MKWLVVAVAILTALPALAQTPAAVPATPMTPTPDDLAKQWLHLADASNYAEAWKQAGPYLRTHFTSDAFAQSLGGKRSPMGAMSSRTLKDVKLAKTLPGMRDGQYAVVRYDSAFAHKASAVESVTLASQDGAWSVIGYQIG